MVHIITKKFKPHYNRAMGKVITSERQYKEEMKRGGYCSQEDATSIARRAREKSNKAYAPSDKARAILNSLHPDRKGKVKLSDRAIDGLKSMGVSFDQKKVQEHIKEKNLGG
jgi:hypothetical protein